MKKTIFPHYLIVLLLVACAEATPTVTPTRMPPTPTSTSLPTALPTNTPSPSETATATAVSIPATPERGVILHQNNPQRTGVYHYPAIRNPVTPLWQTKLSGGVFGVPMVADGLVYVSGDNRVYIFDGQTGEQVGSITGVGAPFSPLAIAGNLLISGDTTNSLLAYDRHTYDRLWETAVCLSD